MESPWLPCTSANSTHAKFAKRRLLRRREINKIIDVQITFTIWFYCRYFLQDLFIFLYHRSLYQQASILIPQDRTVISAVFNSFQLPRVSTNRFSSSKSPSHLNLPSTKVNGLYYVSFEAMFDLLCVLPLHFDSIASIALIVLIKPS